MASSFLKIQNSLYLVFQVLAITFTLSLCEQPPGVLQSRSACSSLVKIELQGEWIVGEGILFDSSRLHVWSGFSWSHILFGWYLEKRASPGSTAHLPLL